MINFRDDIKQCLFTLKNGGIILYPTDTIWGIGCDATNEKAVEKIYELKKRKEEKSLIILLANENDLSNYIETVNTKIFDYINQQKKPTTFIYDGAKNLAKNLINKDGTIAIRIVQDEFCKQLFSQFKKPIVSTSANISGQSSPNNFADINLEIKNGVDYIVQHRQSDLSCATASAIKKWNADGTITIIRS